MKCCVNKIDEVVNVSGFRFVTRRRFQAPHPVVVRFVASVS